MRYDTVYCMNNPLYDPEQLEYRGPKLDPEYDDIPEDPETYLFTCSHGEVFEAVGEKEKEEMIEWLDDMCFFYDFTIVEN